MVHASIKCPKRGKLQKERPEKAWLQTRPTPLASWETWEPGETVLRLLCAHLARHGTGCLAPSLLGLLKRRRFFLQVLRQGAGSKGEWVPEWVVPPPTVPRSSGALSWRASEPARALPFFKAVPPLRLPLSPFFPSIQPFGSSFLLRSFSVALDVARDILHSFGIP